MFITVEIAGKQHRFLFDTGAPVQITPDLAAELKSASIKRTPIVDATGRKDSLNVVNLAEIKLGNTTFNNIPSLITGSDVYTCWHIDGVLGSNILRKSIVRIDPVKQLIIITDNAKKLSLNKKDAARLVTDPIQSYPYILVGTADVFFFMIGFDSGESSLFVPAEKDMVTAEKYKTFTTISTGYGTGARSLFGLQKSDSTRRILFPAMKIGQHILTNFTGETNKSNMTRMGTRLLDYGGVTLDFIHQQFYFDTKADTIHIEKNSWPIKSSVSGNHFVVGTVWQALKGQVDPGDQILAVDELNTETIDLCQLVNRKTGILDGKQSVTLTIRDSKGNVKKIMMKKE
ncbi:retropepsin-like aspartic protease [Mucilaginibacter celer]|uniref:Aspartyl protease n=1 Tax=Mucilaginibacter celer TaxID=2305508 RepID=A0A494VRH9_9SPHI|nr:retropepsin-like aspartic protease [Mucilaginibacter celer]AYL97514.1 hypothetical protein HYN43_020390 [Mucilaginibacter celer]